MVDNPLTGAGYLIKGLGLLNKPGLRRFVAIPLLVNVVVFSLLIWLGVGQFEQLMDRFLPNDESWLSWLRWLLWPLFAITLLLIIFYTFTVIANLIAAPFNGLLAEKVERYLGGEMPKQASGAKQMFKDVAPALLSELRKLLYFLLRAIPLLILFLIPGLNVAAPFLWMLFSAWFLALEYGDYPMANHNLAFKQQHKRLKQARLSSLSFGGGLTLMMMVPILNFVAMPAAVAGATLFWHERLRHLES
ncbi:MAG: sulfate transporter CysZ [gamma proteobacterium symbiont of Ctena orbiculata]|nr:sulfate transporter CysZ [Candidatus Thiodiazotropha sp. (ex Lucina pensylvanica)]PUB73675.1 MAG: sulfate transporter CysZ [gamma proteobacterium symbiont of Ctena orbiculata]PUB77668.1 MAG: sulfate transporter CysZ [gamma proteobacterium symbiont of Ctena orbiculata]